MNKYLKCIIFFMILSGMLFFLFSNGISLKNFNIENLKNYILSYGKFAALIFIVMYALKPIVLVIPTSILSILAGNVFGPGISLFLSMIGCFLSATLAFFLSKILGRSFVNRVLRGKAMQLDSNIEKHGFKIMLMMRLSVVFPYDPLSYAAGLSKMKYRDFILGTMLGILPEMISYSYIGKNIENPLSIKFILPILSVIVIAMISLYIYRFYRKTN